MAAAHIRLNATGFAAHAWRPSGTGALRVRSQPMASDRDDEAPTSDALVVAAARLVHASRLLLRETDPLVCGDRGLSVLGVGERRPHLRSLPDPLSQPPFGMADSFGRGSGQYLFSSDFARDRAGK